MVLPLCLAVTVLVFLPCTHALTCQYKYFGFYIRSVCDPGPLQSAYCCGDHDAQCCYDSDVVSVWWFWFVLIFGLLITIICIRACCVYSRRRSRTGYLVVRGQTSVPTTTVVQSNQTAQVASAPVYPQSYQGYDSTVNTAVPRPLYTRPPPYAPPAQQQQPPPQKQQVLY